MTEYTLKQKLQQLAGAPKGSITQPEFIFEHPNLVGGWDEPLRELAWEALRELERLEARINYLSQTLQYTQNR